ncbi:hypothetical protein BJ875DRAFT_480883 [Amylocarpus encephaloides]|uniref:Uncharacterized protein n=1 Tax=Amylocarpus encephaloides TaxID=45428 RepID=A0A9P8C8K9_9HELO|nr:hypothetical protein BJ875DRAFT_480883 [Amylocarpus encephaloides]
MDGHPGEQSPYYAQQRPRRPHPNLSVWTSTPLPTRPAPIQQAAPASQFELHSPGHPPRIPPEKLEKALGLYAKYLAAELKEGLDQRQLEQRSAIHGFLEVPGPSAPLSPSSHASSRHRKSHSLASAPYDAPTEISSVMSFDDETASPASNTGYKAYNGKIIKQRSRKPLNPKAKAKAALVRYLGSCAACKKRAVSCPLEHVDTASLDKILQEQQQPMKHEPRSPPAVVHRYPKAIPEEPVMPAPSLAESLLAMGQNEQLLQSPANAGQIDMDLQSPPGEAVPNISTHAPLYQATQSFSTLGDSALYSQYQDGSMFAIGVFQNGYFRCQHMSGTCMEFFQDVEGLELHFEQVHFPYNRMDPACRFVCPSCQYLENEIDGACQQCKAMAPFDIWVYGKLIKLSSYQRYSSDDQDMYTHTPTSASYYTASYDAAPAVDFEESPGMDEGGSFNHGADIGTYHVPTNDSFGSASNSHPYGHHPYLNQGSNNHYFHQHSFISASRVDTLGAKSRVYSFQSRVHARHEFHYIKMMLLSLVVLLAISLGITYEWILAVARLALPKLVATIRLHLPAVAFMSIVGSFAMCSSMKHIHLQRFRQASHTNPRSPLFRKFAPVSFRCRQTAPDTYLHGGFAS